MATHASTPDAARRERWKREDAREAKEVAARVLAISEQANAKAVLKLRREQEAKEREWSKWDRLLDSVPFEEYLLERGLCVREAHNRVFHNSEAEWAALGAVLMDNTHKAVAHAARCLHCYCFQVKRHQIVYVAALQVWKRSRNDPALQLDIVTVTEQLRRNRRYEQSGGANYLTALIESCPGAANIAAYCESVIEAAQRRVIHAAGEVLLDAVCAEDGKRWSMSKCGVEGEPMHSPARLAGALKKFCDELQAMNAAGPPPDLAKILQEMK
jgi:hypothetical protein